MSLRLGVTYARVCIWEPDRENVSVRDLFRPVHRHECGAGACLDPYNSHGSGRPRACRRDASARHDDPRGGGHRATRGLSSGVVRLARTARDDRAVGHAVLGVGIACRDHSELSGDQFQRRFKILATGRLSGAAGSGRVATPDSRHARRELPKHQDRRHDDVRHRSECDGGISAN